MDGFSYFNIFETKGIEYLAIIAFFAMLIPFWLILNKQVKLTKQMHHALGVLTSKVLRVPQGLFYSRNHTWTYLEKSGIAKVGLDDLLLHLTGEVKTHHLKKEGEFLRKGEPFVEIEHQDKLLTMYSPISGEIINTNSLLLKKSGLLNEDPYGKGWVLKVKPSSWVADTNSYYLAEEATKWSENELTRVRDFLATSMVKFSPEPATVVLQDGGELRDNILSELPKDVWCDFHDHFLKPVS